MGLIRLLFGLRAAEIIGDSFFPSFSRFFFGEFCIKIVRRCQERFAFTSYNNIWEEKNKFGEYKNKNKNALKLNMKNLEILGRKVVYDDNGLKSAHFSSSS